MSNYRSLGVKHYYEHLSLKGCFCYSRIILDLFYENVNEVRTWFMSLQNVSNGLVSLSDIQKIWISR